MKRMKRLEKTARIGVALMAGMATAAGCKAKDEGLDRAAVEARVKSVADWILAHPSGRDTRHWVIAPLYDGLLRSAFATGEPRYIAEVVELGRQSGWMPGPRRYHADDHAVGHAWLDIYFMDTSREDRLEPFVKRFEEIFAQPRLEELDYRDKERFAGVDVSDRWTWCDALYMAPPTLARLHAATGDDRYLDFLEREFRFTYDRLYDAEEQLFYRDTRFLDQRTGNGKKIFWSRGNGWVYGGLALTLERFPESHAFRPFLENLFMEMTSGIIKAQQEDGLWRPSLRDPEQIAVGETSGSGFFAFGLAWGINNGYLDRETYMPHLEAAWNGLLTRIEKSGRVGYVQGIGSAPDTLTANDTEDYGVGAVLLAGAELMKTLDPDAKGKNRQRMFRKAEAILSKRAATPRAYARLVPERKDDLAWENDLVAFRVYGPALAESQERSGVDVWCKSVARPIINTWYAADLRGEQSYHEDTGEGFDGYKVGATVGCGGTGIWDGNALVQANVYERAAIHWTADDEARFTLIYKYPETRYGKIVESKEITLKLGERSYRAVSRFMRADSREPVGELPVAIGLVSQSGAPIVWKDAEQAALGMWEAFHEEALGTAVQALGSLSTSPRFLSGAEGQSLMVLETDADGVVRYRAGFAWSGGSEIEDAEEWKSEWLATER